MDAIQIGRYMLSLIKTPEGMRIWIQKDDGEGMATGIEKLEKVIAEYFEREF